MQVDEVKQACSEEELTALTKMLEGIDEKNKRNPKKTMIARRRMTPAGKLGHTGNTCIGLASVFEVLNLAPYAMDR